jgi:ABC-type polysaccharide/polyol phosphate export permease
MAIESTALLNEFYSTNQKKYAIQDLTEGLQKWHIWLMLAYQDIKLRYRRSILGPFWLTLSMAITVYSMGFLYSHLFHTDLQTYFPFLASGLLSWTLISAFIIELTDSFTAYEGMIKQLKLPYTLYIHRIIARNIIIFFHNIVVIIPIMIIFPQSAKIDLNTLLLIPGLFLLYINAVIYGMVLAIIGTRYRDISQIIKSLVQVIFFLTPVMWNPNILPAKDQYIVAVNPFYAFIELIRAPILGNHPSLQSLTMVAIMTTIGILLSASLFTKYRARIVYWL